MALGSSCAQAGSWPGSTMSRLPLPWSTSCEGGASLMLSESPRSMVCTAAAAGCLRALSEDNPFSFF
jgi:hypothetical protein